MKRSLHLLVLTVLAALLATFMSPAAADTHEPAVTITSDKSSYVAGQTAKLVFHVSNAGSGTTLKVVTKLMSGKTVERETTVTDGQQKFSLYMYVNTQIRAYIGGSTTVSAYKGLPVKAAVGTRPRGGYLGFSGSYAIFPKGSSPVFRSTTFPSRPGIRCLHHEVWKFGASGWKPVLRGSCRVQNSKGQVDWKWAGKHGSNVKFRVRAIFPGDKWNQPSSAPFSYFKFK